MKEIEKIGKEKILEMLCSKDIELRRLGKSILEQNYEIPYRVYYHFSYTYDSIFSLKYYRIDDSLFDSEGIFLRIIQHPEYFEKSTIKSFIEAIIKYNE